MGFVSTQNSGKQEVVSSAHDERLLPVATFLALPTPSELTKAVSQFGVCIRILKSTSSILASTSPLGNQMGQSKAWACFVTASLLVYCITAGHSHDFGSFI